MARIAPTTRTVRAALAALALLVVALGAAASPPAADAAARFADARVSAPRAVRAGDRTLLEVRVSNAGTAPLGAFDVVLGRRRVAPGGNLPGFPAVDAVGLAGLAPGEAVTLRLDPRLGCGEAFDGKVALTDDGAAAAPTFPDLLRAEERFARRGDDAARNNERFVFVTAASC